MCVGMIMLAMMLFVTGFKIILFIMGLVVLSLHLCLVERNDQCLCSRFIFWGRAPEILFLFLFYHNAQGGHTQKDKLILILILIFDLCSFRVQK